jgi:hypothetical protein
MRDVLEALLSVPRWGRVGLTALFAVSMALALVMMVQWAFGTTQDTFWLSVVGTVLGLVAYIVGWRYYVGTIDEPPPPSAIIGMYFIIGLVAIGIVLILLAIGVTAINTPA